MSAVNNAIPRAIESIAQFGKDSKKATIFMNALKFSCGAEWMYNDNIPVESFQWYLDLRRYGSVPHSGFGYGLERLVTWLCGLEHVRESIPFARTIYRLTP